MLCPRPDTNCQRHATSPSGVVVIGRTPHDIGIWQSGGRTIMMMISGRGLCPLRCYKIMGSVTPVICPLWQSLHATTIWVPCMASVMCPLRVSRLHKYNYVSCILCVRYVSRNCHIYVPWHQLCIHYVSRSYNNRRSVTSVIWPLWYNISCQCNTSELSVWMFNRLSICTIVAAIRANDILYD